MPDTEVRSGGVAEALANGRSLLAVTPQAALAQADVLLRAPVPPPAAFRLKAAALRRLARVPEAEQAEAAAVVASRSVALLANAARAMQAGSGEAHVAGLRAHLMSESDDAVAHLILGEILATRGALHSAEASLRSAIDASPAYVEAHVALARVLYHQARPADALTALDPALKRHPGNVDLLRFRATLLTETGAHTEAADLYRRLLQHVPNEADLWIGLGNAFRTLGKREQSAQAYRLGLARSPGHARLYWNLAALGRCLSEDELPAMEQALAAAPTPDDATHLHFAIATVHETAARPERAFEHYLEGNRLRRDTLDYDADGVTAEVARSERLFDAAFLADETGAASPAPIFVVGMPRSGSTLVEQILASHPQIEGTAELPIIPALIRTFAAESDAAPGSSYRDLLAGLSPDARRYWGEQYLARAAAHRRTGRPFFIDKLPHNWLDLGFIRAVLPNARIIDVRRNPLDCCVSNFRLLFAQGHPSSFSLTEMAAFYRDYVRLMRHFETALPGYVHRVIYERLVEDLEGETRRLLAHLQLPFDPACLDFHKTERSVATASADQVRRPLNREGIGAWRRFEPWLDPLKETLGDLPETYAQ